MRAREGLAATAARGDRGERERERQPQQADTPGDDAHTAGEYDRWMLLRQDHDSVIAIGQASHAWICGQLARAWSPRPEPFEQVALAAEQHDVGMAEWDLRPTLNADTRLPHSFLELPVQTHIGLWERAPYKLLTQSRYAALLTSMHGAALQGLRDLDKLSPTDRALVEAYLEDQRRLRERLIELLAADREQLARNQRLVWAWDSFSLGLCLTGRQTTVDGHRAHPGRHGIGSPSTLAADYTRAARLLRGPATARRLRYGARAARRARERADGRAAVYADPGVSE